MSKSTYYRADYVKSAFFKLPAGINLDDKKVVEVSWVRYDTMYVKYVGKEDVVEYKSCADDEDCKTPYKLELDDTFGYLRDSDEDEDNNSEDSDDDSDNE